MHWQPVADSIQRLTNITCVDRILLLTAVNGTERPTHTSAIWQYRPDNNSFVPYHDEPIDDDYLNRMLIMKRSRYFRFKTSETPIGSKINYYYVSEGVVESVWVLLGIRKNELTGQVAYKYASFATHSTDGFTDEDLRQILIVASDMKTTIYSSGFTSLVA